MGIHTNWMEPHTPKWGTVDHRRLICLRPLIANASSMSKPPMNALLMMRLLFALWPNALLLFGSLPFAATALTSSLPARLCGNSNRRPLLHSLRQPTKLQRWRNLCLPMNDAASRQRNKLRRWRHLRLPMSNTATRQLNKLRRWPCCPPPPHPTSYVDAVLSTMGGRPRATSLALVPSAFP